MHKTTPLVFGYFRCICSWYALNVIIRLGTRTNSRGNLWKGFKGWSRFKIERRQLLTTLMLATLCDCGKSRTRTLGWIALGEVKVRSCSIVGVYQMQVSEVFVVSLFLWYLVVFFEIHVTTKMLVRRSSCDGSLNNAELGMYVACCWQTIDDLKQVVGIGRI